MHLSVPVKTTLTVKPSGLNSSETSLHAIPKLHLMHMLSMHCYQHRAACNGGRLLLYGMELLFHSNSKL